MRIAVFGATGRTGQHLLDQALERGHKVTAFARSPEKIKITSPRLEVVQGDVQNPDQVEQAVKGADAVISVLGPTENKPTFTVTKGTQHILDAMQKHAVDRLVVSAGAGVADPNDEPNLVSRFFNLLLKLFSRWVYEDMQQTVETVRNSDLSWTVVRVPMLSDDEPTGEVKTGYVGKGMGIRITRADMAGFMLDQIERDEFVHKAPAISS
jgi:putative NADH-flavin reductase